MDENLKNDILYRPILGPEKDYKSDGSFHWDKDKNEEVPNEDIKEDPYLPAKLREQLVELKGVLLDAPKEIQFIINAIPDKLIKRIDKVWPNGAVEPTRKLREFNPEPMDMKKLDSDIELDEDLPDLFPPAPNIEITLEQPISMIEVIQSDYQQDELNLTEYYIEKMQYALQTYYQHLFTIMAELGIDSITALTKDFDGEAVKIPPNRNLEHCRDHIVRTETYRKQKAKLFKKTHSVDETLVHLRSWHAAFKQRERYYSESYGDADDYTLTHANLLLKDSREQYDAAYKDSVYSMYKYLDSSVKMTQEILADTLTEAQAKAMLLKNGVNIYATSEIKQFQIYVKNEKGEVVGNTLVDENGNVINSNGNVTSVSSASASGNSAATSPTPSPSSTSPSTSSSVDSMIKEITAGNKKKEEAAASHVIKKQVTQAPNYSTSIVSDPNRNTNMLNGIIDIIYGNKGDGVPTYTRRSKEDIRDRVSKMVIIDEAGKYRNYGFGDYMDIFNEKVPTSKDILVDVAKDVILGKNK